MSGLVGSSGTSSGVVGYDLDPNKTYFVGRGMQSSATIQGNFKAAVFASGNVINNGITQNASTGKCSVPIPGLYMMNFTNGNATSSNQDEYISLAIYLNSTLNAAGWSRNIGYDRTAHCHCILNLSTSDTIAFCYEHQYGTLPDVAHNTVASMFLIG